MAVLNRCTGKRLPRSRARHATNPRIVGLLVSNSKKSMLPLDDTLIEAEFTMMTPSINSVVEMRRMPCPARIENTYRQFFWGWHTFFTCFVHNMTL